MRSAIRGDFARLAERRGEQELMRVEQEVELPDDPIDAVAEPEDARPPARSWLARFLSS